MAPSASSTNDAIREFYGPRTREPSTTQQRQPMPPVEHPKTQRSVEHYAPRGPKARTRPRDDDQTEAGCLGEIKNYKAGDEFVLLWKWVDDFLDKRRAKKNSSKSDNGNRSASRQNKPIPSPSRRNRQVLRPVVTQSPEAVRRQANDSREYKTPHRTPWRELFYSCQTWKDQQAKKKADQQRQRQREDVPEKQTAKGRDEYTRGRSINRREPSCITLLLPDRDHAANSQPGIMRKPIPVYNKKRGEVPKHTVKINQLPPVRNSVHLQHSPSNNYRAKPSPSHGPRDTRISDFLHQERNPPTSQNAAVSRKMQDEAVRFSSVLDPAKAIKKAKEAEKAKAPVCYISCQIKENKCPKQCSVCGEPNSPGTTYGGNLLWMCTACRSPTTPREVPPSPKFSRKATSKAITSRPPIQKGGYKDESEDVEHFIHDSHASLPSYVVPISEYDSDHLYSDDSYEAPTSTLPAQKPVGLGITFQDQEDDTDEWEEEEEFRPTPPLKDTKYHSYQDSPTVPTMDYNQSHLRKPGTKHPYAPSPAPTTRTSSVVSSTHDLPRTKTKTKTAKALRHQPKQSFNPTTYSYPSPPDSSTTLHKPRPASSVYPTDEPTTDFSYPLPPIPLQFVAKRQQSRSSSISPVMRSKGTTMAYYSEPVSPRSQSSPVSVDGRKRRSSWYDFWKPVFEKTAER